jgi:hypothetical protein
MPLPWQSKVPFAKGYDVDPTVTAPRGEDSAGNVPSSASPSALGEPAASTTVGTGDPAQMATAMIASVDQDPAPRRLVLGSDAYQAIETSLTARLADVRTQRESAAATDDA